MYKQIVVLLFFITATFSSQKIFAIDLKKGQTLSCSAIVCAVGIAIPASHNKCRKVLTEWSIFVATLGIFQSKPKCPRVDNKGVVTGYDEMTCSSIQDATLRKTCEDASNTGGDPRDCGTFDTPKERIECLRECEENGERICSIE